ncbi:MAG: hypothetical protein M3O70_11765 [Actinomycetota bacterium]|nr:hypothetical protein [Actinomycetota bacterium]
MSKRFTAGLSAVLGSEVLLRGVLVPAPAGDAHILVATAVEWVVFAGLVMYWIPRVECLGWPSVGLGTIHLRDVWWGAGTFLATVAAFAITEPALAAAGLPSIRSLQPILLSQILDGFGLPRGGVVPIHGSSSPNFLS